MVTLEWWVLVVAPAGTMLIGVGFGYWLRMSSVADLQRVVDMVIGDTIYNVSGDYIERPFEEIPPTH